ncbi:MAG TPA: EamA family transporter [Acidimicrobiales bacterium]|nr:EamA family transporter [Acidimicrobiales bacterium]
MPTFLALLSSLLWGTADFMGGTLARRLDATRVVLVSQATALAGLGPLVLLLGPDVTARAAVAGVIAGAVGAVALNAFYRALALGTMGVVAPIAALGVAVPVVVGLVSGEEPRALQLAGIAVAVVGVVLASGPELRGEGRGGAAPLLLALLAASGFGTVMAVLADGSEGGGVAEAVLVLLVMRATSVVLLGALVAWQQGPRALRAPRADLRDLAVIGAFDVGANGTFAVASQSGLVSVTAVLASLYPAVTAVLAWQRHGERLRPLQLGGVGAALAGVVLLSAG